MHLGNIVFHNDYTTRKKGRKIWKRNDIYSQSRDPGQSSIEKGRNLTLLQEGKDPDFRCSVETTGSLEVSSDDIRDYVRIIFRTTLTKAKEIEDKLIIGKTVKVYGHFHDGRKSAFLGDMLLAEEITNFDFKIEKTTSTKKIKIGHETLLSFQAWRMDLKSFN